MPQYMVAIHHPDGYDGSQEEKMWPAILTCSTMRWRLRVPRFFAGGLQSASAPSHCVSSPAERWSSRMDPTVETKEHIGGFWILNAANMDEAVAWGRKAVVACRASVECASSWQDRQNRNFSHRTRR